MRFHSQTLNGEAELTNKSKPNKESVKSTQTHKFGSYLYKIDDVHQTKRQSRECRETKRWVFRERREGFRERNGIEVSSRESKVREKTVSGNKDQEGRQPRVNWLVEDSESMYAVCVRARL